MAFKIAIGWVALQALFFIGWAGYEQSRLRIGAGQSILVHVRPADPRDYLRGQYFQFGYDFSAPSAFPSPPQLVDGAQVWVVLAPGVDTNSGYHMPKSLGQWPPAEVQPGDVILKGRYEGWRLLFGVESYFVREGTETPDFRELSVRLRVGDDGEARIEQVSLRGVSWP